MSITNEMKTVDATLGKTKRELAIKDAEIMRINQDLSNQQDIVATKELCLNELSCEVEEKRKVAKESERKLATAEDKVWIQFLF